MSLDVRAATVDDLPRILELTRQDSMHAFDEPETVTDAQRAAFAEIDADAHQDLLVGEADGEVVTTCQVTYLRVLSRDGALYCQVENVRTEAAWRGRGIGTALMQHVEDAARARGSARIQLTSNTQRIDAHRFYERLGFEASHVGMKKSLS